MIENEEKEIMVYLGRPFIDGDVRGMHLGKVLTYLKITNTENLDSTYSKLALVLGVNPRYVRENYIKGLLEFGVLKLYQKGNTMFWKWIGAEAFNGHQELKKLITKPPPTEKTEKYKDYVGECKRKCRNCGKEINENQIYCNEDCIREYYKKRDKKE